VINRPLQWRCGRPILRRMNKLSSVQAAPPHIAVAPGLLAVPHTQVREPGETDERYRSRSELLGILLDFAARQD
jgi:hypothetical protein